MYLTQMNTLVTLYYLSPPSASHSNYSFLFAYKKTVGTLLLLNLILWYASEKVLRTLSLNIY